MGINNTPNIFLIIEIFAIALFTLGPLFLTGVFAESHPKLIIPKLNVEAPIVKFPLVSKRLAPQRLQSNQAGYVGYMPDIHPRGCMALGGLENKGQTPAAFYRIDELSVGDLILVSRGAVNHRYRVMSVQETQESDVEFEISKERNELRLISCANESAFSGRYPTVVTANWIG
jgi:LPXTG-site transpeptidase (sortase) family protein